MSKMLTNRDIDNTKEALYDLIQKNAFIKLSYPTKLSSGITSEYYFDIRKITLSFHGASIIDMIISHEILKHQSILISDGEAPLNETIAIGGLETGSLIIVGNLMNSVFLSNKACGGECMKGFYIRKKKKDHGLRKIIEGDLNDTDNIVIVDDVITTGQSIRYTIGALAEHTKGIPKISKIITIIDRTEEHGYYSQVQALCKEWGIEYIRLFSSLQFINADYPKIKK
jgi:orotate phosphoribosyltransferase